MSEPHLSVTAPLTPAWERMRRLLFAPFDLGRWLVLGFAAWLAGLGGNAGTTPFRLPTGGLGDWNPGGSPSWREGLDGVGELAREAWSEVAFAGCLAVGALLVLLVIVAVLVGLWASSRGRFVFLDSVVTGRVAIVEPWKRMSSLGNSLFLFRLLFGLVVLGTVGLLVGGAFLALGGAVGLERLETVGAVIAVPLAAAALGLVVLCLLTSVLVAYLLEAFVVPLMYRHRCGAREGWSRFLPHFRSRPAPYLVSGLLLLVLHLGIAAAVTAVGFLTCCLGFLVLAIPYLGTVLLLPVPVFVRAYTVELLAQVEPALLAPPAPGEASPVG